MKKTPSQITIPPFLQGCLWSYNLQELELKRDFRRIITNVLIYGDMESINWLFTAYSSEKIQSVLSDPLKGEWDAKSLNFWSGHFQITTNKKKALKKFPNIDP